MKTIENLQKHNEKEHVPYNPNLQQIQDENESLKERIRELDREVKTNERAFKLEKENFEEEKKTIKEELNKENAKVHKDNIAKMKEISEQLSECREEIKMQVEINTKLKEENKVLKGIEEAQDLLDKEVDPEVIELDAESSDISDEEAADVFLKNKNDTGTRPKNTLKCCICNFVAKDEILLRGHMSMHHPGNGNYQNGVLSFKDGYKCNRCGEAFKTMGLIKRHMKVKHNINISPTTPNVDGATSADEKVVIKCDRCDYRAETKEDLVKHLGAEHVNKKAKCTVCQMVADNMDRLNEHMKSHHTNNNKSFHQNSRTANFGPRNRQPQNRNVHPNNNNYRRNQFNREKPVCKFRLQGNCFNGTRNKT